MKNLNKFGRGVGLLQRVSVCVCVSLTLQSYVH